MCKNSLRNTSNNHKLFIPNSLKVLIFSLRSLFLTCRSISTTYSSCSYPCYPDFASHHQLEQGIKKAISFASTFCYHEPFVTVLILKGTGQRAVCQFCAAEMTTNVTTGISWLQVLAGCGIFWMGGIFCCWIPCVIPDLGTFLSFLTFSKFLIV